MRSAFATNGQAIYGIDMATGAEGDVASYPSPDALWNLSFAERNAWRERFAAVPFEDKGGAWQGRYYQDIAITRVLEAIAAGPTLPNLRILLTLATGTGKTFIAFQLAWHAGAHRARRDQEERPGAEKNGSIVFTIFQTFMSGPLVDGQPAPYFGDYLPDFCLLCHAGPRAGGTRSHQPGQDA